MYEGKTVLVTGASSGLGAHVARRLAGQGACVIAAARRLEILEAMAAEIPGIRPVTLDVANRASVTTALSATLDITGRLDAVVNNAGIAVGAPALEMAAEDWDRVIDINLSGVFRVAQAAAEAMRATGQGGAIVNVASILGLGVQPGLAAYSASKAGVAHLTRALALEWARHGIRVNALAPGYIPTEMNRDLLESEAGQAYLEAIPMRRFGRPEDLDGPLDLLLGPAGAYVTGVVLPVDGGHLCRAL